LFISKARKRLHSQVMQVLRNTGNGQKGKQDVAVIFAQSLKIGQRHARFPTSSETNETSRCYPAVLVAWKKNFINFHLFPVHFGLELDFTACLVQKGMKSEASSPDKRNRFFNGHQGQWVQRFFDDVRAVATHPYFSWPAMAANRFLRYEKTAAFSQMLLLLEVQRTHPKTT